MKRKLLAAALTMSMGAPAWAQSTLGDLLDAKARKLSGDEFKAAVVGKTIAGPTTGGSSIDGTYAASGGYSGAVSRPGWSSGVTGSWTAEPGGKVCADLTVLANNRQLRSCVHFWKLGEAYYMSNSESDSDRGVEVFKRDIR